MNYYFLFGILSHCDYLLNKDFKFEHWPAESRFQSHSAIYLLAIRFIEAVLYPARAGEGEDMLFHVSSGKLDLKLSTLQPKISRTGPDITALCSPTLVGFSAVEHGYLL